MPTVNLSFNNNEDHNLPTSGTVTFNSDFNINDISRISIRGLGEWRNVPENVIHVNERILNNILTRNRLSRFNDSGLIIIGIKANHDILLSFKIREKGLTAVKNQLTKFFKTLSAPTRLTFEDLESDEDTNEEN